MRLKRLEVTHCAGIASAAVDLKPGLNVLHGPNELGKSTLAAAIRAALLLQTSSRAADRLRDWHADADPAVTLTFEHQAERIWRVRKRFLAGGGAAHLDFSRDGRDFSPDSKGREVEAALQAILRWGIEPPGGGRGGPRGMPSSLIATALLGSQDDVTAILGGNLADDASPTGRDHLAEALQALAEDPRFKQVLNDVQEKVDEAFTTTGIKRSGRGSPWAQLRQDREQAEMRRRDVAERQRESEGARNAAGSLREAHEEARQEAQRLTTALDERRERQRLETGLRGARAALADVQDVFERLAATATAKAKAENAVADLKALQDEQSKRLDELAPLRSAAEKRISDLESGAGEQGRQLRMGALENELLKLAQQDGATARRIDALREVVELGTKVEAMRNKLAEDGALLEQAQEKTDADEADLEELELKRTIIRFNVATGAVQQAKTERDEALAHAAQAESLVAQASELRADVLAMAAPDEAAMARLRDAATDLRVAQEKLAVGIVMDLSVARGLGAEVTVDGGGARHVDADSATDFEAERELLVTIDDVVDIRVRGGGHDLLRQAEDAERRWRDASASIFARTGCPSIDALNELRRRAAAKERDAAELERQATEAGALGRNVDALERRLVEARAAARGRKREVEEFLQEDETLEDLLGDASGARGTDLDAKIETLERNIGNRKNLTAQLSSKVQADRRDAESLDERITERVRQLDPPPGTDTWQDLLANAEQSRTEIADAHGAAQRQLDAIRQEAGQEVEAAHQAHADIAAAHDQAQAALAETSDRREAAERDLARLDGQLGPLQQQAERQDLAAATRAVETAEQAVEALPPPTDADANLALDELERQAAAAEQRVRTAQSELDKAEGALQQVGGQVLDEQAAQAREALAALDDREHELEVDYGAWRMLRDVLKQAEAEDTVHLGRALVKPVSERMAALTAGRYGEVDIGPQLEPGGIELDGAARDFDALSVGTQEQIAMLLRLAIAEALGSFMVLDDQLTQSDRGRLAWMRGALAEAATNVQIIVLTCHPDDYTVVGPCNVIDLTQCIERSAATIDPVHPPPTAAPAPENDLAKALKDSL